MNYFPFKTYPYSQYECDVGEKPYQQVIDYVNGKNGVVFWAHPESGSVNDVCAYGDLSIKSKPYQNSLLDTWDYAGFGYFYEGREHTGKPGGVWDKTLNQYCAGVRKNPVWGAGELDLTFAGEGGSFFKGTDNIVFAESKSDKAIIEGIKKGRYYFRWNSRSDIRLDDIYVQSDDRKALLGETLECKSRQSVKVYVRVNDYSGRAEEAELTLIKNGAVARRRKFSFPFEFIFSSESPSAGLKDYYRIEVKSDNGAHVVTNPIFVVSR